MEIFSKNVEFEKLGVKTTLLGLERDICFQPNNSQLENLKYRRFEKVNSTVFVLQTL